MRLGCSSTASEFCHPSTYSLRCNIHQGRHLYVHLAGPKMQQGFIGESQHPNQITCSWLTLQQNLYRTRASGCLWPDFPSSSNLLCGWEAGGGRNSCLIFFWNIFDLGKNCHHHSPTVAAACALNKVFKRPLLIYNRFVQGLIYGFWRRPVCKIIRDYQMDFEKCNKIINYLDYPNRGRIWTFITWQTIAGRLCGHDGIAWHMLPILASGKTSLSTQNNSFMTCVYVPLVNSKLFQRIQRSGAESVWTKWYET